MTIFRWSVEVILEISTNRLRKIRVSWEGVLSTAGSCIWPEKCLWHTALTFRLFLNFPFSCPTLYHFILWLMKGLCYVEAKMSSRICSQKHIFLGVPWIIGVPGVLLNDRLVCDWMFPGVCHLPWWLPGNSGLSHRWTAGSRKGPENSRGYYCKVSS